MIRAATTEADLAAWTRVRNCVQPDEASTVEDVLTTLEREPERRLWLGELDGAAVACSFAARSETSSSTAVVLPRVLPGARRQGLGTALLRVGSDHARELGCDLLSSHLDAADQAAAAFAGRFGFVEVDRQVELVRELGESASWPPVPAGIEIVPVTPELLPAVHDLALEAARDLPLAGEIRPETVAAWVDEMAAGHTFVALAGDEVVGLAGLSDRPARPGCAENTLTAVRRSVRGRGVATALKLWVVAWAAENGYRELDTWTQKGNVAMQAVNERVGYRPRHVSITVQGPLLP